VAKGKANPGYKLEIFDKSPITIKAKMICTNRGKEPENNSPGFDFCRKLLGEGYKPSTKLEVYRNNTDPDLVYPTIGEAAKWFTKESQKIRPKFAKYEPFPKGATFQRVGRSKNIEDSHLYRSAGAFFSPDGI
jgi:hypothetical protein